MDAAAVAIYPTAYALAYFSAIGIVALWESYAPRRRLRASLSRRWVGNFVLTFVNTLFIWALKFPLEPLHGLSVVDDIWRQELQRHLTLTDKTSFR